MLTWPDKIEIGATLPAQEVVLRALHYLETRSETEFQLLHNLDRDYRQAMLNTDDRLLARVGVAAEMLQDKTVREARCSQRWLRCQVGAAVLASFMGCLTVWLLPDLWWFSLACFGLGVCSVWSAERLACKHGTLAVLNLASKAVYALAFEALVTRIQSERGSAG